MTEHSPPIGIAAARRSISGKLAALRHGWRNPSSKTHRGISSALWSGAAGVTNNGTRLAANLLTTQILMPEAFALTAVVFVLHAGLGMVTDAGIEPSIVRSDRGEDPAFLHTAFVVNILRNAALGGLVILLALALWLAQGPVDFGETIYGHPELPLILGVSSLVLFLRGWSSPNVFLATRHVRMRQVVLRQIVSGLSGFVCTVAAVYATGENIALLVGPIVTAGLGTLLSHRLPGPPMRLAVERDALGELWSFGRWIMGSSMLGFLRAQGDRLITSAMLGVEAFALYVIARIWLNAGIQTMHTLVTKPIIGLVSEASRESEASHRRVSRMVALLLSLLCGGAFLGYFFVLPEIFGYLYRAEFQQIAHILPALSGALLWQTAVSARANMIALGNSRYLALVNLYGVIWLVVTMPIASYLFGLIGVIASFVLSGFVIHAPMVLWESRMLERSIPRAIAGIVLRLALALGAIALASGELTVD